MRTAYDGILARRDDFFAPLAQHFNRFWDDFFKTNPLASTNPKTIEFPKITAYEDGENFNMHVSVPGTKAENLSIQHDATANTIKISGRMDENYRKTEKNAYLQELRTSSFERTLTLPDSVSGEPDAVLKDGILTLKWKLVTKEQPVQTKCIPIKSE